MLEQVVTSSKQTENARVSNQQLHLTPLCVAHGKHCQVYTCFNFSTVEEKKKKEIESICVN